MNLHKQSTLQTFREHIELAESIYSSEKIIDTLNEVIDIIINTYKRGNKILLAGNGGSSADSQHMASEMIGKLCFQRNPLPAISLSNDTASLTAISNDMAYENIFSRQLKALCNEGDTVILYSTSGNSPNIINAAIQANKSMAKLIGFTGKQGGLLKSYCDKVLIIPSNSTQRIQEMHHLFNHIICENVEKILFN